MALPQVRQGAYETGQLPAFQVPKPKGLSTGRQAGEERTDQDRRGRLPSIWIPSAAYFTLAASHPIGRALAPTGLGLEFCVFSAETRQR